MYMHQTAVLDKVRIIVAVRKYQIRCFISAEHVLKRAPARFMTLGGLHNFIMLCMYAETRKPASRTLVTHIIMEMRLDAWL